MYLCIYYALVSVIFTDLDQDWNCMDVCMYVMTLF